MESGGWIFISLECDLFTASEEDRAFLCSVIEPVREYLDRATLPEGVQLGG